MALCTARTGSLCAMPMQQALSRSHLTKRSQPCFLPKSYTHLVAGTRVALVCGLWGRPLRCSEAMPAGNLGTNVSMGARGPARRWSSRARGDIASSPHPTRSDGLEGRRARCMQRRVAARQRQLEGGEPPIRAASLWTRTTVHGLTDVSA